MIPSRYWRLSSRPKQPAPRPPRPPHPAEAGEVKVDACCTSGCPCPTRPSEEDETVDLIDLLLGMENRITTEFSRKFETLLEEVNKLNGASRSLLERSSFLAAEMNSVKESIYAVDDGEYEPQHMDSDAESVPSEAAGAEETDDADESTADENEIDELASAEAGPASPTASTASTGAVASHSAKLTIELSNGAIVTAQTEDDLATELTNHVSFSVLRATLNQMQTTPAPRKKTDIIAQLVKHVVNPVDGDPPSRQPTVE